MSTILFTLMSAAIGILVPMVTAFLKTKRDQYNIDIDDAVITQGVRYAEQIALDRMKLVNLSDLPDEEKKKRARFVSESKPKIATEYIEGQGLRVKRSNLDEIVRAKVNELFG